ncbi:MAG TPA: glycosyltransferase [Pyrinomonadaceae bacterium]
MNLINSNSLRVWKDRAVEFALKTVARKPRVTNAAWRINPEELHGVTIRWPVKYQWEPARIWVDPLLYGFRNVAQVEMAELEQPYRGTVLFQFVVRNRAHDVAIDYSDYSDINEESARRCPVYFKMQHHREGYGLNHVLPGGYVPDGRKIYLHLPRLRRLRDRKDFAYDVYGRFSLEFAGETRRRAVEILRAQKDFKFEGGLTKVSYVDFLKETARSRICIDLPGEGDFCYRLVNYFAVGACVIAAPHRNILNGPLIDREHIAYAKPDFSDLVELCKFYLENEEEREAMCLKSRQFFEQYLHKDNLTAYYLRACLDRLRN